MTRPSQPPPIHPTPQGGFTLIEMVMVIVLMGVVGGMVSVFMRGPIDAYFATARRAGVSDAADTTVRRMARDIRKSLPNSIRNPSNQCIEFIPTKTGGRYRAEVTAAGTGDILDFAVADTSFDMLGTNPTAIDQAIVAGDVIAIYNLGPGSGSDAYATGITNTSPVGTVTAGSLANETKINITGKQFPMASGSNRFHVITGTEKIVSYVCTGGNLYRNANYAYTSSCPTSGGALLAKNATCSFTYSGPDLSRNALVQLSVTLTEGGEDVNLYQEVHVSNTP